MTKEFINKSFKEGKVVEVLFGIKQPYFTIDGEPITQKQYDRLMKEFKNQTNTVVEGGGFTKHIITYKPQ